MLLAELSFLTLAGLRTLFRLPEVSLGLASRSYPVVWLSPSVSDLSREAQVLLRANLIDLAHLNNLPFD